MHQVRRLQLVSGIGENKAEYSTGKIASTIGPLFQVRNLIDVLRNLGHVRESSALADVLRVCTQPHDVGGLDLDDSSDLTEQQESEVLFLASAWLEALNSEDRSRSMLAPLPSRPPGRRGMTLSEKIFALHDVAHRGWVAPGDLIRVDVDWVLASEASWAVRITIMISSPPPLRQLIGHGGYVQRPRQAGDSPERSLLARR
jgi:hypothetical protein